MSAQPWTYGDGETDFVGELYPPTAAANGRAVLVVHEADGIGGNVRRRCAMLAAMGYHAAAPDMHGGGRVLDRDEIPAALANLRADPAILRRRIRAALDSLGEITGITPAQTAAIGYCFGGFTVLELARSGAPVAAVVSFHGLLTTELPAPADGSVTARILACTGALDPLVPQEHVAAFQQEMIEAGTDWNLLVHGRALHSYTNSGVADLDDPRMRYDPAADRQSWAALLAFFGEVFG